MTGRREFGDVYANLARGKRNWQLIAYWSLALVTVMLWAYMQLAASSRVVPYIVALDKVGAVQAVGPADRLTTPEPRVIAFQLGEFIRDVRTVLPGQAADAQQAMMRRGYAFVEQTSPAASTLNAYFADPRHDPRVLAQTLQRAVQVTSTLIVPTSAPGVETWRLRWTETEAALQPGVLTHTAAWEGYVTITLKPPTTAQQILDNPLGLYVTSINWTATSEEGGGT